MNFRFKKRKQQEKVKDYFDDSDDEDKDNSLSGTHLTAEDDEEVDPLDAFMNDNTVRLKTEELRPRDSLRDLPEIVSGHGQDDAEGEGEAEEQKGLQGAHSSSGGPQSVDYAYDSDGTPLGTKKGASEKVS